MRLSIIALLALSVSVVPALAAKPSDPGGFGKDRAAYIHDVAQTSDTAPGASEMGHIMSDRAGENGTINNDYKCAEGQVPASASFC
ncbi:hypothetical protein ASC89_04365 [Devosia sp. Root413D1]|uniref:hypothetical protein n=1 Tax=Devosia sp. Root413D1 TaxID=1736531 RepID=UPI0006F35429|nr:hypothetical protein [Devosia sp. Root413D1]KQW81071.1 hypothetical protein ASC89_04365 [Devosia sp. Root413D1]